MIEKNPRCMKTWNCISLNIRFDSMEDSIKMTDELMQFPTILRPF